MGFPKNVSLVGSVSQSPFLTVFGEECGCSGFHQAVLPRFSSLPPTFSSLLIHPFFLVDRPRRGFDFGQTCSFGISPGRLDILSRKDDSTIKWLLNCV